MQDALAQKADRSETGTRIATLQAALQRKADYADVEQSLARKLDVRTFLASQATQQSASAVDSLCSTAALAATKSRVSQLLSQPPPQRSSAGLLTPQATPALKGSPAAHSHAHGRSWMYTTPRMASPVSAENVPASAKYAGSSGRY